ncbi:tripartite tricarboxylate transporter TctB family protein [Orrella sp. JC864]|uniref:tripartite tricarboxylate transporter TctB family protein n=1 Tax=Orrella sp. JC864 TaxID=3120298 RepID=UPI00300BEA3D
MRHKSARLLALACVLAFGWAAWMALSLPPAFSPVDVGPGQVPLLAAVLGMACGVYLFARAGGQGEQVQVGRPRSVACGLLLIASYVLLMPHAGFYLSSLAAFPLLMLAGGERRAARVLACTIGYLAFVYVCFDWLLDVQFP